MEAQQALKIEALRREEVAQHHLPRASSFWRLLGRYKSKSSACIKMWRKIRPHLGMHEKSLEILQSRSRRYGLNSGLNQAPLFITERGLSNCLLPILWSPRLRARHRRWTEQRSQLTSSFQPWISDCKYDSKSFSAAQTWTVEPLAASQSPTHIRTFVT
jgi:hypothetical protein